MCINHVKETEESITLPDFLRDGGHIKKKSSTKCLGFTEDETQRYELNWITYVPSNKWVAVMEGEGENPQVRITQPDTDMCLTTEPFPELPGAGYPEPSVYLAWQPCSESGISPLFLDSYYDTSHSAQLVDYSFVTTQGGAAVAGRSQYNETSDFIFRCGLRLGQANWTLCCLPC